MDSCHRIERHGAIRAILPTPAGDHAERGVRAYVSGIVRTVEHGHVWAFPSSGCLLEVQFEASPGERGSMTGQTGRILVNALPYDDEYEAIITLHVGWPDP